MVILFAVRARPVALAPLVDQRPLPERRAGQGGGASDDVGGDGVVSITNAPMAAGPDHDRDFRMLDREARQQAAETEREPPSSTPACA